MHVNKALKCKEKLTSKSQIRVEDVPEMLLVVTIASLNAWVHVDGEGFVSLLVGSVLRQHNFVLDDLCVVELSAEDAGEVALRRQMLQAVLAVFALDDAEVDDQAGDLLLHGVGLAASDDCDVAVFLEDASLQVKSVDLVSLLSELLSPVHLLRVLCLLGRPLALLQVQAGRLDGELGVDDEGEDGLVLPIDTDRGRDVVAEG